MRRMIKEVEESKEHPMKGVVGSLTEENLVNLQLQEPTWGSLEPSIDELGQCPWKRCNFFCYPPCPSCHFTAFHFISLHFISLHFTSPHFTSLHFTSLLFIHMLSNNLHNAMLKQSIHVMTKVSVLQTFMNGSFSKKDMRS